MTEIPQDAISAVALVLAATEGEPDEADRALADDVLRAAAPLIAAAERERIRQLAIKVDAASWYDNDGSGIEVKVPFTDLLTDPEAGTP